jgi:tetratricopeptide (TPR) repeat protein
MLIKTIKIFPFILLSALSVCAIFRMNQINFIQDDAFITLRYVENFINGNGLVFNTGYRVEGYTNFLWVLLISLIGFIGTIFSVETDLPLITQLLSQLSGIALIILAYFFTKKIITAKYLLNNNFDYILCTLISLVPPFLISFAPPFLYWGVSGMESVLFTFLTCFSFYRYIFRTGSKPDIVFVTASVLNSLLRPEGILIFLMIMCHSIIINYKKYFRLNGRWTTSSSAKVYLKEVLMYAVPIAAYLAFRYFYYGFLLPNTFYAKTGFNLEHFSRGLEYVFTGIINNFFYGLLLVIPLLSLIKSNLRSETIFFYFFVIIYLLFIILIGGDVLPISRFILPVLPLVIVFSVITLYQLTALNFTPTLKFVLIVSVLSAFTYIITSSYFNNYKEMKLKRSFEIGLVKKMKVYAGWIKNKIVESNQNKKVALSTIGAFSFYSGAEVIDIVGLTDKYIAHNPKEVPGIDEDLPVHWKERRYNAEYVLKREPDYIIFPAGAKPTAFAECAIFVQPQFYKNYYCQLIYSDELKQLLPIYTKRNKSLEIDFTECDVKFVKPYIEANNLFLNMNEKKNFDLMRMILDKCDEAELKCILRKSEIDAVRGFSFYHAGNSENAKLLFENSIRLDSLNMISRFYLMKIYHEFGDETETIKQYQFIKRFSPDALPANYITH